MQGKRSTRRKKDENDMCAFDLLATVAGNLLADQDNSSNVPNTNAAKAKKRKSVKEEHFNEILPLKDVAMEKDVGSGSVRAFPRQANNCLAENSSTRNGAESILESLTMKSNMLAKIPECGSYGIHHPGSSSSAEPEQVQQAEPKVIRRQADGHAVAYGIFDSVDVDGKPPALVSSDSSSCVPLSSHDKEHQTSSLYRGEVQYTADRDDDENSSGCPHPSTIENKGCKPQYLGNHRIRKLLASKVRKAARNKICGGIPSKKICGGLSNKGMPIPQC